MPSRTIATTRGEAIPVSGRAIRGPSTLAAYARQAQPQAWAPRPAARPALNTLRPDRGACKHQRNLDVIRPGRAVHEREIRVGSRDEIAFTRHDQELASASRKIGTGKHVEESLLCRLGVARRRFARVGRGSSTSNHEENCATGNPLRRNGKHPSSRHAVRSNLGPPHYRQRPGRAAIGLDATPTFPLRGTFDVTLLLGPGENPASTPYARAEAAAA